MKKYTKRDTEFWYGDKIRMAVGIIWLIVLAGLVIAGQIKINNEKPLISPLAEVAHAQEPTPTSHKWDVVINCEEPLGYIRCKYYKKELTEDEARMLSAIAKTESICNTKTNKNCIPDNGKSGIGVDPKAKNPKSSARGMFQIIAGTWYNYDCVGDKYNFKDNTECAIKIMRKSGYTPWEVYNTGSYKRFVDQIEI